MSSTINLFNPTIQEYYIYSTNIHAHLPNASSVLEEAKQNKLNSYSYNGRNKVIKKQINGYYVRWLYICLTKQANGLPKGVRKMKQSESPSTSFAFPS